MLLFFGFFLPYFVRELDDFQVCFWNDFSHLCVRYKMRICDSLQTWAPQCEILTYNAINEKSSILVQLYSNFQRLIHLRCGQSIKVCAKLDKDCGFFINGIESWNFTLGCPGLYIFYITFVNWFLNEIRNSVLFCKSSKTQSDVFLKVQFKGWTKELLICGWKIEHRSMTCLKSYSFSFINM